MYILKGLGVTFFVSLYLFLGFLLYPLFLINKDLLRPLLAKLVQYTSIAILNILNIHINSNIEKELKGGYTIICNHQSYIDILVIISKIKASFLTSYEIKETLFLGQICSVAGCFFTERRHKKGLRKEVLEFKEHLKKGNNVAFFPEGTSTDASEVKAFKKPFFYPSVELKRKIIVLTLNYNELNFEKLNKRNRDNICWYGDMDFFSHFIRLLKLKRIDVSLNKDEYMPSGQILKDVDACHSIIKSRFQAI